MSSYFGAEISLVRLPFDGGIKTREVVREAARFDLESKNGPGMACAL